MMNSSPMTDLRRLYEKGHGDADLLRLEAEIQGKNGALEIDAEDFFALARSVASEEEDPRTTSPHDWA